MACCHDVENLLAVKRGDRPAGTDGGNNCNLLLCLHWRSTAMVMACPSVYYRSSLGLHRKDLPMHSLHPRMVASFYFNELHPTGLYGAMSICAQLRSVENGGEGTHIDVPMLGTSLAIAALQTSEYFGTHLDPVKLGSAHPRNAPYQAFRAKDDYLVMAAGTQSLWENVCRILSSESLLEDERFSSTALRAQNQVALKNLIEIILQNDDAKIWIQKFSEAGIPCCPINNYSSALMDKQSVAMGWIQPLEMANGHMTKTLGPPIQFDGIVSPIRLRPPRLGEHNDEIMKALK